MREPLQEQDDRAWAESAQERELICLIALDNCLEAGADPAAIKALACELGIKYDYLRDSRTQDLF